MRFVYVTHLSADLTGCVKEVLRFHCVPLVGGDNIPFCFASPHMAMKKLNPYMYEVQNNSDQGRGSAVFIHVLAFEQAQTVLTYSRTAEACTYDIEKP